MTERDTDRNIKFLDSDVPDFSADAAAQVVRELYSIEGAFSRLYSERDQNFRVRATDGADYVLKIANSDEDPGVLDMQHQALAHVEARDPDLPTPRVICTRDGAMSGTIDDAGGKAHIVRLLSFMPGIDLADVPLTPKVLRALGATTARLDKALRSFFHPSANHVLLWDLKRLPDMRHNTDVIEDPGQRRKIEAVIDHFADQVLPLLRDFRWQIIHNDANSSNVLVAEDDPERIAGIIDYGDMIHAPLISDVAIAAAGISQHADDPVSAICEVAAGFDGVTPLEAEEVDLIYDLVIARVASEILICTWRIANPTGPIEYLEDFVAKFWPAFDRLLAAGRETVRARLRAALKFPPYCPRPGEVDQAETDAVLDEMLERRRRLLGAKLELFYDRPLHLVRGDGVWLYDAAGRRYLDAYNNVPQVGHAHPHVVRAVARQVAALNTNTRYVYRNILDYAERLVASMPGDLGACVFVNSGSEANDVAWRMARVHSGHDGALVMEHAYHGVTEAIAALSPYDVSAQGLAPHVRTLIAPDTYRGPFRAGEADLAARYGESAARAIDSLAGAGLGPAAFMIDTSFCSNGILDAPEGYLAAVVDKLRAAGGVLIADEVQYGFGRSGSHMWGFETHGVAPEIVTLGKPIGNGYPVGVVVTTPEILRAFTEHTGYFSTFGGNPVGCAAGLAVLDVIEAEGLLANARDVGDHLRHGIGALARRHGLIGDVRGQGLLIGVELVRDRATQEPAGDETVRVTNHMRENGVLVGREGLFGNVLKIRPPMVFAREHADMLIEALDRAVGAI